VCAYCIVMKSCWPRWQTGLVRIDALIAPRTHTYMAARAHMRDGGATIAPSGCLGRREAAAKARMDVCEG